MTHKSDRIDRDFPYYDGRPVEISAGGWLVVLGAVVIAFLQLTLAPWKAFPLNLIPSVVFTGLPLIALMAVTGWRPPAVFHRFGLKGVLTGLGFAVLTIASSFAAGIILLRFMPGTANPNLAGLTDAGTADLLLFLGRTGVQLVGEELLTILPLLAVLWFCVKGLKFPRGRSLVIAVLLSTVWFAALHLPTYDWNLIQCLTTIGTARVFLTLAYLVTRNLWVSSIAHIANDWSLFVVAFVGGHLPIGTEAML